MTDALIGLHDQYVYLFLTSFICCQRTNYFSLPPFIRKPKSLNLGDIIQIEFMH